MTDPHEAAILLLEDDPAHVWLIERNLRRSGVTSDILAIGGGREALNLFLSIVTVAKGAPGSD